MSEELGYLCHYPRTDIPTDPPPERDAATEFDLLLGWLDERGTIGPDTDWSVANSGALRRVCEQG